MGFAFAFLIGFVLSVSEVTVGMRIPPQVVKRSSSIILSKYPDALHTSEYLPNSHNSAPTSPIDFQMLPCDDTSMCNCPSFLNLSSYDPNSAVIPCDRLDDEFVMCELLDESSQVSPSLVGCSSFGATGRDAVPTGTAMCIVLENITCAGSTIFFRQNQPCLKYNGFRFPTAFALSFFLGCVGADRWYLRQFLTAPFKMITCGGCFVWWFIDLILLSVGLLVPADDSSWEPFF